MPNALLTLRELMVLMIRFLLGNKVHALILRWSVVWYTRTETLSNATLQRITITCSSSFLSWFIIARKFILILLFPSPLQLCHNTGVPAQHSTFEVIIGGFNSMRSSIFLHLFVLDWVVWVLFGKWSYEGSQPNYQNVTCNLQRK